MGQCWMFSVGNVTFTVCCIASIVASSLGILEPLCVYRNFNDILCRWENIPSNATENDDCSVIIAVKFAKRNTNAFEECVESSDTPSSNYSSCVLDYPAAWVNETLSIMVVSSNRSANTSTVFDYDPKQHVILSPPILNFTRRKYEDNVLNITINITYLNPDTEKKIVANCGPPELSIVYTRAPSLPIEEYTEESSWGDWKQANDGSSWRLDPFFKNDFEEKNITVYKRKAFFGSFRIVREQSNFLSQVRWRVNSSLCRSHWGPYRTYRFTTDDITVGPINYKAMPGANVTLRCESTVRLSKFYWKIMKKSTWTKFKQVSKQSKDGYVSYLHLSNVTTDQYTIECSATSGRPSNGMILSVGVAPPAPIVECLMENKDTLHCRYNVCNPQIEKQRAIFGNYLSTTWQSNLKNSSSSLAHRLKHCYYSDIVGDVLYHRKFTITAWSSNKFGASKTVYKIARDTQIQPTSPVLEISYIDRDQDGAVVNMTAQYSKLDSSDHISQYCRNVSLRIAYKVIANDIDVSQIKFVTDSYFWEHWGKFEDELIQEDVTLMNNATLTEVNLIRPEETTDDTFDGHEPLEFQIPHPLAANTRYLIAVKWKFESRFCQGYWSIPSHKSVRIGNLKPPKFRDVTLMFLSDGVRLPGNFRSLNWSEDPVFMVWNNIDEGNLDIQERNKVEYTFEQQGKSFHGNASCHEGCNVIISSGDHNHMNLFNVTAFNEIGTETSATFRRVGTSVGSCAATVISMSLASISDSHIVFKVDWIYSRRSPPYDCVISDLEKRRIHVHLLTWKEINPESVDNGRNRRVTTGIQIEQPAWNNTMHSSYMTVARSTSKSSKMVFGTRVSSLSDHVNFTYSFQADSSYGMGVALSQRSDKMGVINQSPTTFDTNLYYYTESVEQSKGAPEKLITSEVGIHQMKISWLPSKPQERSSPVTRYEIFARSNKRCSFGHNETVCDLSEVNVKDCYETPSMIYQVRNVSGMSGWIREERNYNTYMSVTIENLEPGIFYYIVVWEITEAGRNKCSRHVAERTLFSNFIWIILAVAFVLFVVAAISLVAFRRKVKKILGIDIPEPHLSIPLNTNIHFDEQPITKEAGDFQEDDESNYYVALSRSPELSGVNAEMYSDILDDDETPLMVTIPKNESAQRMDIEDIDDIEQENGLQNNNDLLKLCRSDCQLMTERPATCRPTTSEDSLGRTMTESSSIESDEPCCSASSVGNIGDLWPQGNSICDAEDEEDIEDAYVSASEAARMSWSHDLENSVTLLSDHFI